MSALATIKIDDTPENVAAMMARGQFHSHQDGRWRYSAFGGDTAYCNDPTAKFDARAAFDGGLGAAVCKAPAMFAAIHRDGTRGLTMWDADRERQLWFIYRAQSDGERARREWIAAQFGVSS
jgi:hypothetical protein